MTERLHPRALAVLVGMAALVIALAGLRSIGDIIGPAFLAVVLIITVYPIRSWMVRKRVPAGVAALVLLLSVYLLLVLLTFALVLSVARLAELVPEYSDQFNGYINDIAGWLENRGVGADQVRTITNEFDYGSLVGAATDILQSILGILSDLVFILILLLFLAFDAAPTTHVVATLKNSKPDFVEALASFASGVRRYMAVSAGFGLVCAVLDSVALVIMGIPGAFVWGVLSFVTNFIPNIGFVVGVVPPALIGLLEGGPGMMIAVIVVYVVINFVVQSVVQPRIIGDAVGLSATLTFLSLIFWAAMIGPLGALLAVPLSLLFKALLVEADPEARWLLPLISGKAEAKT
ncbi:AI-2 transport protein TqsA [Marmoricola sp. OAE513]|uniref:AI-2E family transporter n=1 Tax=Marmoricola sp. OAE513 TaxID=2817894 RepID=UPI001AE5689A